MKLVIFTLFETILPELTRYILYT